MFHAVARRTEQWTEGIEGDGSLTRLLTIAAEPTGNRFLKLRLIAKPHS